MKLFWKSEQRNRSNFRKAGILLPAEGIDAKDISKWKKGNICAMFNADNL